MSIELTIGKLYKIVSQSDAKPKRLWIDAGTIDILTSDKDAAPANQAAMVIDETGVSAGTKQLGSLPKWICITQDTGTTTTVSIEGFDIKDEGAIV